LSSYAASSLCLAGSLRTFHARRYDAVEGPRNMRASAVRTEGPKKQFRRPHNTQVSTMATETMLRRSLRLRRPNEAQSRTTTHGDIKPVNPVYASKHRSDLDSVCDHPNTPVTSITTISTSARHKHQDGNLDCPRHQCLDDIDPVPGKHQVAGLNYPRSKHTIDDLDCPRH
ncbi:hypothetical protein B0H63DRAFT_551405, partial [Podospora didyma]